VTHVTAGNFAEDVLRSDGTVLVDFYAPWCGPCRALSPTLEEIARENPRARVVKVDVDSSPELADRYGVSSVPSLMVFKNGRVVARQQGVASKTRLLSMLDL
jgi:thioredoxin 1